MPTSDRSSIEVWVCYTCKVRGTTPVDNVGLTVSTYCPGPI